MFRTLWGGPLPLLFTTILGRFPTEMQTMALIVAWPGQNASSGTKGVVKYDDQRAKGEQTDLMIESVSKKWIVFKKNCWIAWQTINLKTLSFRTFVYIFFVEKKDSLKGKNTASLFDFNMLHVPNLQLPKACNFRTQRRGACVDFNQRPSGKPSGRFHFRSIRLQDLWGVISFTCSKYFRSDRIVHQKIHCHTMPHQCSGTTSNKSIESTLIHF